MPEADYELLQTLGEIVAYVAARGRWHAHATRFIQADLYDPHPTSTLATSGAALLTLTVAYAVIARWLVHRLIP